MSGAAVWLVGSVAVASGAGVTVSTVELAVGTAVCAGSALLPDIDSPESTVARVFGLPSQVLAEAVNGASAFVYNVTRTRREDHRDDGHRTLTHTGLFAVVLGLVVSALTAQVGKPAVLATLFVTLGLCVRGLMGRFARRQGWLATTVVTSAGTGAAYLLMPAGDWSWLGLAVGVGAAVHLAGDMITKQGCPVAWPLVHRGKRWWEFAPPALLRIRAGGPFERMVLLPALSAIVVLCAAWPDVAWLLR